MRCRVNEFVTQTMIQETCLPSRCPAMDGRSDSDIIRRLGCTPHYYNFLVVMAATVQIVVF
jgi:hypothetical protein